MSRWDTLPAANRNGNNPTFLPQNAEMVEPSGPIGTSIAGTGPDEVYQSGSIGQFIGKELEGGFSSFIRCIYQAKRTNNKTITLVCEKAQDCCEHDCCPKDQQSMEAVYILLAFVLLTVIVGTILMIVCYQRSKNRERKEEREAAEYNGYAASQIGGPGAYTNYGGPTY